MQMDRTRSHAWPAALLLALAAGGAPSVHAQLFTEVDHVDLASIDPATNDGRLGRRIALANGGRTLLAAAPHKEGLDQPGTGDGSVYSFSVLADGTLRYEQEIAPLPRYLFGEALAADGEWAALAGSGRVHIMRLSGSTWNETQLITLADVVEPVGVDVRGLTTFAAMDGDLLALGNQTATVTADGVTKGHAGAVVLFRRGGDGQWRFEAVLVSPTPSGSSGFGSAISILGDAVLVGAQDDSTAGEIVGGAYLFERSGEAWAHAATLRNPEIENERFGWAVAVGSGVAVVGCATCLQLPNPSDPTNTGSFFVFERNLGGTGNWGLRGEFLGSNPRSLDNFSGRLRLRGDILMVGSTGSQEASFFIRRGDGDWTEVVRMPSNDVNNTNHGASIDFMGGKALVGADAWPDDGSPSAPRRGAVSAWFSATVEACGSFEGVFCDDFEP